MRILIEVQMHTRQNMFYLGSQFCQHMCRGKLKKGKCLTVASAAMAAWAGTVTLTGSRVGLTGNNELRGFYPNSDLNVHNDTS